MSSLMDCLFYNDMKKNFTAAVVSSRSSYLLDSEGVAYSVGYNQNKQLGTGATIQTITYPASIGGALSGKKVLSIHGCTSNGFAIADDNKLYGWGKASNVGTNPANDVADPIQVTGVTGNVVDFDGVDTFYALTSTSAIFSWGLNNNGQLGNGGTTTSNTPVAVITTAFNSNRITKISAGATHACALDHLGAAYCWGKGNSGELGNGAAITTQNQPIRVANTGTLAGKVFVSVTCSSSLTLMLTDNGVLYAFGFNTNAGFGDGTATSDATTVGVTNLTPLGGKTIATVRADVGSSIITLLTTDGSVFYWGLLSGSNKVLTPTLLDTSIMDSKAVFATGGSSYNIMTLSASGKVYAFGSQSTYNELGSGFASVYTRPLIMNNNPTFDSRDVTDTTMGNGWFAITLNSKRIITFGSSTSNPVSGGGTVDTTFVGDNNITKTYAAQDYLFMLKGDGKLYGVGGNTNGGLGDGTNTKRTTPVQVLTTNFVGSTFITQVATGVNHNLAITSDNKIYGWGTSSYGELGCGSACASAASKNTPMAVDMSNVLSGKTIKLLSCGNGFSLVVDADGQLGIGSTANQNVPVAITGGEVAGKVITQVGSGSLFNAALTSDNVLLSWGGNSAQQLGDGGNSDSGVPKKVTQTGALSGKIIVRLFVALANCFVVTSDGMLYGWGNNNKGLIIESATPTTGRD
ncbi:E3 ubiquitin-protein ligase [Acrasis kona]|uniref:E3 ubiquitin-protein ligase n=1 Tax=Acrasis kona TaxID=1008807 RepID=A0AAW2ZAL6_9EUKA